MRGPLGPRIFVRLSWENAGDRNGGLPDP